LISFRHFTNKNLLIWAGFLLFIPILHWLAMYFTNTFYPANLAGRFFEMAGRIVSKESTEGLDSNFSLPAYFAITNFKTWIEINLHMPLLRLSRILMEGRAFKVLGFVSDWHVCRAANPGKRSPVQYTADKKNHVVGPGHRFAHESFAHLGGVLFCE
jgi:hypothetical protein